MDEFNDFEESKPELPILYTDSDGQHSNKTCFVKTEIPDTSNETFANVTVKNEIPEDECSETPHILIKNEIYNNYDLNSGEFSHSEFVYPQNDPLKIENFGTHFLSSHVKEEIGEEIGEELGEELSEYDSGI